MDEMDLYGAERPEPRRTRRTVVVVAAAIVVAAGGGAVAMAAGSTSHGSTGHTSSAAGGGGEAPAPSPSASSGSGSGGHGPAGGFRGLGGLGALAGGVVHGTVVVRSGSGYVTEDLRSGTVTALSSTSITVRSSDGTSGTFALTSSTKKATDFKRGATVLVIAKAGTAVSILDTSGHRGSGGSGGFGGFGSGGQRPSGAPTSFPTGVRPSGFPTSFPTGAPTAWPGGEGGSPGGTTT